MKKIICLVTVFAMLFALAGCGGSSDNRSGTVAQVSNVNDILSSASEESAPSAKKILPVNEYKIFSGEKPEDEKYDIDLTAMNSTMVYSEVSNMMMEPQSFEGKYIKMRGNFAVYEAETRNYYACLISDATACCSQGIEFVLKGNYSYPDDYPPLDTEITVTGIFDTYNEGENTFIQLLNAKAYYGA